MNAIYPRTSTLAVVSLIAGLLAWFPPVLPMVGAVIAVVCGHVARAEIRRAPPGSVVGEGMALAGLLLGWIQLVAFVLMAILFMFALMAGVAIGSRFI